MPRKTRISSLETLKHHLRHAGVLTPRMQELLDELEAMRMDNKVRAKVIEKIDDIVVAVVAARDRIVMREVSETLEKLSDRLPGRCSVTFEYNGHARPL